MVAAVFHGYYCLLNTSLSNDSLLVAGRRVTGLFWHEEIFTGVEKQMPCDAEEEMKRCGAKYEKPLLPFVPSAVVDDRLVTGQNPASAKVTAKRVIDLL